MMAVPKYLKVEHTVAMHCMALVMGLTREFPCPMEWTCRSSETCGGRPLKNGITERVEFNAREEAKEEHSFARASLERRRALSSVSEKLPEERLMTSCS